MLVLTPGAVPHLASRVCFVAVRPSIGVPPGAFRVPASRCSNPLKRGLMTHKHINAPHTHTQCLSKPVCAPRWKKWRNARSMTYDVGRRARESASRRARAGTASGNARGIFTRRFIVSTCFITRRRARSDARRRDGRRSRGRARDSRAGAVARDAREGRRRRERGAEGGKSKARSRETGACDDRRRCTEEEVRAFER